MKLLNLLYKLLIVLFDICTLYYKFLIFNTKSNYMKWYNFKMHKNDTLLKQTTKCKILLIIKL